jgi:HK97 family phage major capsid protein
MIDFESEMKAGHPVDTRQTRADRAHLLDEARTLLDRAKPTAMDIETARQKTEAARSLGLQIARYENHNDSLAYRASRGGTGGATGPEFRTEHGRVVRGIRRGESFRSALNLPEEDFSLGRFLRCLASGDWSHASPEERSSYAQGTLGSGGYLLSPAQSANIIDRAVARSIVAEAGATIVPMETESLKIGVVASDPQSFWTAENALITESEGAFNGVEMRSRALGCFSKISKELLANAANIEEQITAAFERSLSLGLDYAALNGDGAAEMPTGLLNSSQVTESAATGAFTYDKLLAAMSTLWSNNVEPKSLLMHPDLREFIAKMKNGEGEPLQVPADVAALRKFTSTQLLSSDANGVAYVGDFSNVLIGIRSTVEIEMSPFGASDSFQRKQVVVRGLLFGDVCIARAGDIAKLSGITGL